MSGAAIQRLARKLSDTEVLSGEAIADELGCSRTAVWKHVQALRHLGIEIEAVAGQGYRLKEPLELLDKGRIFAGLDSGIRQQLTGLKIESHVDSTNSALQRLATDEQHARVILAEHQSTGRGRRGRNWYSPYGRNLYLSLGWRFEQSWFELGCLPLVAALSVARALNRAGLEGHSIKWPNDLLINGRKLSGCLVEVQGDAQGPFHSVLGIGINVHMPATEATDKIDQPWTDLNSYLPGCSRNELAVFLLEEMLGHLTLFADKGFSPFRKSWEQLDGLKGLTVNVDGGGTPLQGTAVGIDERGALLLDTGEEVVKLHSGEVSVKSSNTVREIF